MLSPIKKTIILAFTQLTFTASANTLTVDDAENCSAPSNGIYRLGGNNKSHIYEKLNSESICWSQVNKIIIAPRSETLTENNNEYDYVFLALNKITAAREARANDSALALSDPAAVASAKAPLLITNGLSKTNTLNNTNLNNTQVRVGGRFYFSMSIEGGSNWKLSGAGDLQNFPGHYPGKVDNYNSTQGRYGFLIDGYFIKDRNALGVSSHIIRDQQGLVSETYPVNDFEIEYIEISRAGFAGMHIKTERRNPGGIALDNSDFPMKNIHIHDNYIHDSVGEGIYLGSTSDSKFQHSVSGVLIENNRIVRTGAEAIQAGQLTGNNVITNNVFGSSGTKWRAPFQIYQDSTVQLDLRTGKTLLKNNIIQGAGNNLLIIGDNYVGIPQQGDGVFIENNYFSGTRFLGAYIKPANTTSENFDHYAEIPTFSFKNNHWSKQRFERNLIDANIVPVNYLHQTHNDTAAITFEHETWSAESPADGLIKQLPTGNGVSTTGNISGVNNIQSTNIDSIEFQNINSLFSIDGVSNHYLDILNLDVYTMYYGSEIPAAGNIVDYSKGSVVMTQNIQRFNDTSDASIGGGFYQCIAEDGCALDAPVSNDTQSDKWIKRLSPFDLGSTSETFIDNFVVRSPKKFTYLGVQLNCTAPKNKTLLPIVEVGQFGNKYFPMTEANNNQRNTTFNNEINKPETALNATETRRAFFYSDENKGRTAYLDLGPNYNTMRIEEVWTQYSKWSQRKVNNVNTAHTGFKNVWWHQSLDDDSGILEPQINFHTALISDKEHSTSLWKQDKTNTTTIVPKGRYLVVESYPLNEDYDYSAAIEFAFIGWYAEAVCN